jgi:hypothetical protein
MRAEPSEESEMDMTDLAGVPMPEEVLPVGLDVFEPTSVDTGRVGSEPSLRTRDAQRRTDEVAPEISGEAVDRVTFGHGQSVAEASVVAGDVDTFETSRSCPTVPPYAHRPWLAGPERSSWW